MNQWMTGLQKYLGKFPWPQVTSSCRTKSWVVLGKGDRIILIVYCPMFASPKNNQNIISGGSWLGPVRWMCQSLGDPSPHPGSQDPRRWPSMSGRLDDSCQLNLERRFWGLARGAWTEAPPCLRKWQTHGFCGLRSGQRSWEGFNSVVHGHLHLFEAQEFPFWGRVEGFHQVSWKQSCRFQKTLGRYRYLYINGSPLRHLKFRKFKGDAFSKNVAFQDTSGRAWGKPGESLNWIKYGKVMLR